MHKRIQNDGEVDILEHDWNNAGPFAVVYVGEMLSDAETADGKYRFYKIVDAYGEMPSNNDLSICNPLTPWTCAESN